MDVLMPIWDPLRRGNGTGPRLQDSGEEGQEGEIYSEKRQKDKRDEGFELMQ